MLAKWPYLGLICHNLLYSSFFLKSRLLSAFADLILAQIRAFQSKGF